MAELEYASRYEPDKALRPSLRVEFIAIPPRLPTTLCSVRPLVDELANQTTTAPVTLPCVSVVETYCEKIISYLRRATEYISGRVRAQYDARLARHIYDVHQIVTIRYPRVTESPPIELFSDLLVAETIQYGNRDARFAAKPVETLQRTLARITKLDVFREHYDQFAGTLIYGRHKPTFDDAFATFRSIAGCLLRNCESLPQLAKDLDADSTEHVDVVH